MDGRKVRKFVQAATQAAVVEPLKTAETDAGTARAGLPPSFRFHDLRGTAATLALSSGAVPSEVARSLGHDPAVLMRTYVGAIPGGREAAAGAIERALR